MNENRTQVDYIVFEELMDTLSVLSPKLYKAVISKLKGQV